MHSAQSVIASLYVINLGMEIDPIDALSAVFGPLQPVFGGDAYANVNPFNFSGPFANDADHYENVQPEDMPPLPEISDQEAAEMADRWNEEFDDN
jgi:hypothetical protein